MTKRSMMALYAALLVLGLGFTGPASAQESLSSKLEKSKPLNVPGQVLTYTAGDSEEKGLEPWRHLQRFQVHLREEDTENDLAKAGCETNIDLISCEQLEGATSANSPKGITNVKRLTYRAYDSDWSAGVSKLFREALRLTNDEKQAAVPWVEVRLETKAENFPEPACEQYSQPCYSRAVCTVFGGCSKSKYSCQQCNP